MKGIIFDIKKFSIHDGPGIRTTVFLKGCTMRCQWCHNPESHQPEPELILRPERCIQCASCVEACPHGAISLHHGAISYHREKCIACGRCTEMCYAQARELIGREVSVDETLAEIERDVPFYKESGGGVTFSGGEPLLQRDFLSALLQGCQERGIHAAVDTCGAVSWDIIDGIRTEVDLFLYDLKLIDDALHRKFTGTSNRGIIKNLQNLSARGAEIIIRVPIIPAITDGEENLRQIGRLAAALPDLQRLDILPYFHIAVEKYRRLNRDYDLTKTSPPGAERMTCIADMLRGFGLTVHIGG
jgi:pyruvate formate lyase activating enzyme